MKLKKGAKRTDNTGVGRDDDKLRNQRQRVSLGDRGEREKEDIDGNKVITFSLYVFILFFKREKQGIV